MREHREWQEQFQRRSRKQYPAEFWDKSRRGKVCSRDALQAAGPLSGQHGTSSPSAWVRTAGLLRCQ